jgi:hypothetical protein
MGTVLIECGKLVSHEEKSQVKRVKIERTILIFWVEIPPVVVRNYESQSLFAFQSKCHEKPDGKRLNIS